MTYISTGSGVLEFVYKLELFASRKRASFASNTAVASSVGKQCWAVYLKMVKARQWYVFHDNATGMGGLRVDLRAVE